MSSLIRSIHVYVAFICTVAVGLLIAAEWAIPQPTDAFWNCLVAFLALGVLSESAFLKLRVGSATSSVAFIPYLASVVLLGPAWAMVVAGGTELVAETVVRRKPAIKVLHNTGKEVIGTGLAGFLYVQLGGQVSLTEFYLAAPAFGAAVLVYSLVNTGAPSIAIALSTGSRLPDAWRKLVGGSVIFDFFLSPLALLLAFLYAQVQLVGVIVVIVPLFLARHIYNVNLQLEQVNRDLLELMVKAIEARDPYTSGHSLRVSKMAGILAREMGLPTKQVDHIETAALLHDVGKIYETYAPILQKEGRLSPEEAALMKTHPIRSAELVRTISGLRGEVEMAVRHHHENYDGSGYPDGLAGDALPIGARIIMVADTTDAMTTDRPYRKALSHERVIEELNKYAGKQFDPAVVAVFTNSTVIRRIIAETQVSATRPWSESLGRSAGLAVR